MVWNIDDNGIKATNLMYLERAHVHIGGLDRMCPLIYQIQGIPGTLSVVRQIVLVLKRLAASIAYEIRHRGRRDLKVVLALFGLVHGFAILGARIGSRRTRVHVRIFPCLMAHLKFSFLVSDVFL